MCILYPSYASVQCQILARHNKGYNYPSFCSNKTERHKREERKIILTYIIL